MKTLHLEGAAEKIDILEFLSDKHHYLDLDFSYDEESEEKSPVVFFRFYTSNKRCSLDEAIEGFVNKMCGQIEAKGSAFGYSEVTIEGMSITEAKIGGHDLTKILDGQKGKWVHILIDLL